MDVELLTLAAKRGEKDHPLELFTSYIECD